MLSIETKILDNDHKGTTGKGTKFELRIVDGKESHVYEYYLMDLINKSFDIDAITKPLKEKAKAEEAEMIEQQKNKKIEEKKQRENDIEKPSKELEDLLAEAISNNTKAVEEFKGGKEKSLNAIVGYCLKNAKERSINIKDGAFTVSVLLKEKIKGKENV